MGANVFVLKFLCIASRHLLMAKWFNCAEGVRSSPKLFGMLVFSRLCFFIHDVRLLSVSTLANDCGNYGSRILERKKKN